jgi:hypothetical protein
VHSLHEAQARCGKTSPMPLFDAHGNLRPPNFRTQNPIEARLDADPLSPDSERNQKATLYNNDTELMWFFLDAATNRKERRNEHETGNAVRPRNGVASGHGKVGNQEL